MDHKLFSKIKEHIKRPYIYRFFFNFTIWKVFKKLGRIWDRRSKFEQELRSKLLRAGSEIKTGGKLTEIEIKLLRVAQLLAVIEIELASDYLNKRRFSSKLYYVSNWKSKTKCGFRVQFLDSNVRIPLTIWGFRLKLRIPQQLFFIHSF